MLFDCLERLQAWRMLHDPAVAGNLDAEGFYDLCKAAGYGEKVSQQMASNRAYERMKRDLPP